MWFLVIKISHLKTDLLEKQKSIWHYTGWNSYQMVRLPAATRFCFCFFKYTHALTRASAHGPNWTVKAIWHCLPKFTTLQNLVLSDIICGWRTNSSFSQATRLQPGARESEGMETKQGAIGWILSCEETASKRKTNFTVPVPNMSNGRVKRKFPSFFAVNQNL